MKKGLAEWHFHCVACRYEGSALEPAIQDRPDTLAPDLDETEREQGLKALRQANFGALSRRLAALIQPKGRPRMLDVGCAHGWFIEINQGAYDVIGIEPDIAVAKATQARGIPVRIGFFPGVVDEEERFDVIVFNDVLEHIPDINGVLSACRKHLNDDGIVVINAPSTRGFLYAVARVMAMAGMPSSFERLWQKGLPSPHVHYLDTSSVSGLAARNGFLLESHMDLPSVAVKGLYARINYAGRVGVAKAAILTTAIALASPFLRVLPADIEVWFLRKRTT